jgi:RNA polymerase sigma-70 factor (ECF subfamily)
VQTTFLKTWKFLLKGGKIDIMKAFLYHILNNLIVDEYRKKKALSLDLLLEKGFEPTYNEQVNVVDLLDGKSALLLIGNLPERYQKIMRMRYVQDLSLLEMSLITGRSKNYIAVEAYRGLELLKKMYGKSNKKQQA